MRRLRIRSIPASPPPPTPIKSPFRRWASPHMHTRAFMPQRMRAAKAAPAFAMLLMMPESQPSFRFPRMPLRAPQFHSRSVGSHARTRNWQNRRRMGAALLEVFATQGSSKQPRYKGSSRFKPSEASASNLSARVRFSNFRAPSSLLSTLFVSNLRRSVLKQEDNPGDTRNQTHPRHRSIPQVRRSNVRIGPTGCIYTGRVCALKAHN